MHRTPGRPKLPETRERFQVRLPRDLLARVNEIARARDVSRTTVVEDAIRSQLAMPLKPRANIFETELAQ